jgi:hypothetical protein
LFALSLAAAPALAEPPGDAFDIDDIPPVADYQAHPVFYDLFADPTTQDGDLAILRAGQVRVQHYAPVATDTFAWQRRIGDDYTWWMQMQEMRFLLPLIRSDSDMDRDIAREWLSRWFQAHLVQDRKVGEWGEPMTWAYRAMVFVCYLRRESARPDPDADVVGMLMGSILEHQRRLSGETFFDKSSNHGFIDALGLYETTRVYDSPAVRNLALKRIRMLLDLSVSDQGLYREHSPAYHFVVLRWLEQIAGYFETIGETHAAALGDIRRAVARMTESAYFLQDHRGMVPQIGDTDSVGVDDYDARYRVEGAPRGETMRFDTDAGFAIYRGESRDRRHVSIPHNRRELVVRDTLRVAIAPGGMAARRRHPGAAAPRGTPGEVEVRWLLGCGVRTITPMDSTGAAWSWRVETLRGRRFDVAIRVFADPAVTRGVQWVAGERSPMEGWYSPRQFVACPAPVIRVRVGSPAVVETRVHEVQRLRDMRR